MDKGVAMNNLIANLIAQFRKPVIELATLEEEISVQEKDLKEQWHEINRAVSEQFTASGYLPQGSITVDTDGERRGSLFVLTFKDRNMVFAPAWRVNDFFGSCVEYDASRAVEIEKASVRLLAYGIPAIPKLLRQAIKYMEQEVEGQRATLWVSKDAISEAKRILSRVR